MSPEISARLAASKIQIFAETKSHFLFGRESCVALVERREAGFGSVGSTGIMTDAGLAYLVWRNGSAFLVGKGGEHAAPAAQTEAVRNFTADLKFALGL